MKKRFVIGVAAMVLAIAGLLLGVSLALGHTLWDTCTKTDGLCYYPGDCRKYIDTNGDGICDRSQPEPVAAAGPEEESPATLAPLDVRENSGDTGTPAAPAEAETAETTVTAEAAVPLPSTSTLSRYFLLPVLLGTAFAYGVTWILSNRKKISVKLHRRIWNGVLLVAALISALLGIYLILEIDFNVAVSLPFDPLFWHVEGGIAMAMVAVFHIAWHWNYFRKMLGLARSET